MPSIAAFSSAVQVWTLGLRSENSQVRMQVRAARSAATAATAGSAVYVLSLRLVLSIILIFQRQKSNRARSKSAVRALCLGLANAFWALSTDLGRAFLISRGDGGQRAKWVRLMMLLRLRERFSLQMLGGLQAGAHAKRNRRDVQSIQEGEKEEERRW